MAVITRSLPGTPLCIWSYNAFEGPDFTSGPSWWARDGAYGSFFLAPADNRLIISNNWNVNLPSTATITKISLLLYGMKVNASIAASGLSFLLQWASGITAGSGTFSASGIQSLTNPQFFTTSHVDYRFDISTNAGQSNTLKAIINTSGFGPVITYTETSGLVGDFPEFDSIQIEITFTDTATDSTYRSRGGSRDRLPWGVR